MLIKKEIEGVPPLPFPAVARGKSYHGKHEYALAYSLVQLPRSGEVLIVDMFRWPDKEPALRFVCNRERWLCAEYPITEWGSFNPDSRFNVYSVSEDPEAMKEVCKFLYGSGSGYRYTAMSSICEWIRSQNQRARWKAAGRKEALMKKHFSMYPELPSDLEDYCDTQVFDKWYLFISKIQSHGQRDAQCTHCGDEFLVSKEFKHNQEGTCPKCGAKVTYKATWIHGAVSDGSTICIADKVDGQLLLRWVRAERSYAYPDFKRYYRFSTYAYNLYLKGGKIYFYKWTCAPYTYGLTWYRGKLGEQGWDRTHIYTSNLDEVFGRSYYNVDLKAGLEGKRSVVSFCQLLNNLKNIPAAEYLFKAGLPQLAAELDVFRYIADDARFEDIYGLSRDYIPLLRKLNATYQEVKLIRAAKRWVPEETILKYRALKMDNWRTSDLIESMETASFERIVNYLTKQKGLLKKRGAACFQLWTDYIKMSKNLNVDLSHKSTVFPKNIQEAHDQLLPRYEAVRAAVRAAEDLARMERKRTAYRNAIAELYRLLPEMPFAKDGLQIALPADLEDLVREGQSLGHCVGYGGYEQKTIEKISMIIFIRKASAPDAPYYTMEYDIRDRKIRQLYGLKNKSATKEVRSFAEGYIKKIKLLTDCMEEKTA